MGAGATGADAPLGRERRSTASREIVRRIGDLREARTKSYVGGVDMIDLGAAAEPAAAVQRGMALLCARRRGSGPGRRAPAASRRASRSSGRTRPARSPAAAARVRVSLVVARGGHRCRRRPSARRLPSAAGARLSRRGAGERRRRPPAGAAGADRVVAAPLRSRHLHHRHHRRRRPPLTLGRPGAVTPRSAPAPSATPPTPSRRPVPGPSIRATRVSPGHPPVGDPGGEVVLRVLPHGARPRPAPPGGTAPAPARSSRGVSTIVRVLPRDRRELVCRGHSVPGVPGQPRGSGSSSGVV